ncbi:response regulator [Inhella sp.]|uniref:response regulator n=1 Tax=Inhella sp. TaxID=1921806 RepID=UPI0035B213B3
MRDDPPRLLLLDDDEDVGLAAQLLLQRRVGPLQCISRPAELLPRLAQWQPALLLLDLNFGPGRTDGSQGLRLLGEVLAQPHAPAVLAMTAYADIPLAVQAVKRGAYDFVTKPWDNAALVALCQQAVQSRQPNGHALTPAPATVAEPPRSLAVQERAALIGAVHAAEGNLSEAARQLGLSRAALYRRLDKHGL